MRHPRWFVATALLALEATASNSAAPSASQAPAASAGAASQAPASQPATSAATSPEASASASAAAAESPAPLAVDPAEAVIKNIEPNAQITFWTYYLSPTFDGWIKQTIDRFQQTYPGVTVNWVDHQGTFQQDLNNAFAAGNAPDVINLSVGEGWVSDYATKKLLLPLDDKVPTEVQNIYFPGLWKSQLVDGKNFQFPWYQSIATELINKRIFETAAGLKAADFPKTIDGLGPLCQQLVTGPAKTVCTIRLSVNDLLAQMVYEGNVKILSEDGKTFTFNSPEAVSWLQMYVDMVLKDKSVDTDILTAPIDRLGLASFSAGTSPFWQTSPNLIREIKSNNQTLYNDLAVVPAPVGKSGVISKGSMGISVKADTKFPNASIALAQFFTNPRSMVDFAKRVPIYPSSPSAYDDPFFSAAGSAIEDSAKPLAKGIVSTYADIVPSVPKKADVNKIVLGNIELALAGKMSAQDALTDAVTKANALIK
ncbi:MAG: extracellular solute-binding protein [Chloroflexota bacterium]